MKSILSFLTLLVMVIVMASCSKENVKFEKMPDNGNMNFKCVDTK